jgi:preprotein translocase subunit SecA
MPDRTWRGGLHQAVEAKEGLEVQPMKDTLARISFQRFFRSYRALAGMTGTAREARAELWSTYRLPVVSIPTNRPCVRTAAPAFIVRRADERWSTVLDEIEAVHRTGRPVLVGTRTVEASERLSAGLAARGIAHSLLNAVRHDHEAAIIAGAGEHGAVTIATNMAGRGTDIRLGDGVADLGGLHVVVTEPHESRRIDRQFFGRAARQGDPGSVRLFASLDDEVFVRSAPRLSRLARVANLPHAAMSPLLRASQRRAQSIARRRRDAVMRADDWLEKGLGFAGAGRV